MRDKITADGDLLHGRGMFPLVAEVTVFWYVFSNRNWKGSSFSVKIKCCCLSSGYINIYIKAHVKNACLLLEMMFYTFQEYELEMWSVVN